MCVLGGGHNVSWRMRRPTSLETFITLWVVTQVALPLHYYLVRRYDDPVNEMFAWRMFSDVHHGASYVEWFRFDKHQHGKDPVGIALDPDLAKTTGMSPLWQRIAQGRRAHAPPKWLLERIALFLCQALGESPVAIAATRTRIPWHGDIVEEDFTWECPKT